MMPSWRKLVSVLLRPSPSLIRRQDLAGNSLDDLLGAPERSKYPQEVPRGNSFWDITEQLYYVAFGL